MSRPVDIPPRPKQALQSYLDGLLQEATEQWLDQPVPTPESAPLPERPQPTAAPVDEPAPLDEFEAAVLEESVRDARVQPPRPLPQAEPRARSAARPLAEAERPLKQDAPGLWVGPSLLPQASAQVVAESVAPVALAPLVPAVPVIKTPPAPVVAEAAGMLHEPGGPSTPVALGLPAWGEEPFECLLFDVAGLTLAVPLVCLGSIYPLAGQELTPLFGQPEWFLGLLPSHNGNLKVLDTARWVMPDRYRDDFQQGLQYVISVQGYEWGLAVHSVSRSLRLDPSEVKWRAQRGQRPWLAGTVIEHMCALLDVTQLAEMIASGAVKRQEAEARAKAAADAKALAAKPGRKR